MMGQLTVPAAATYSTKNEWKVPTEEENVSADDAWESQLMRLAVMPWSTKTLILKFNAAAKLRVTEEEDDRK
jgi:hypothetical protein